MELAQASDLSNGLADRNDFDLGYLANDLEPHAARF
jgi:hypothetical protein